MSCEVAGTIGPPPVTAMTDGRTLFRAALVVDGNDVHARPGALLVEGNRIIAAGRPPEVGEPADATLIDCPDEVLIPGLVNAHCHLDLSHIGPVPYSGDFIRWVDAVRRHRATDGPGIAASVREGIGLVRRGGTALVGDIAGVGSRVPLVELRRAALGGVSYLEVFGLGRRQPAAIAALERAVAEEAPCAGGVRLGLQPHAPYSCGPEVYRAAAGMGLPVATHLAETRDELRFAANATGPFADLIRRLGVWDESIRPLGDHPVDALLEMLAPATVVAAHLNYVESRHLQMLAHAGVSVAYCPRASAYFGHPAHRYRSMLAAGVNVALGTDSVLCLDTPDRMSILDEMKLLHERDGTDPVTLLRMATVNGAEALGFGPSLVTFDPGPTAGVLALPIDPNRDVDPMRQILRGAPALRWIVGPVPGNELESP